MEKHGKYTRIIGLFREFGTRPLQMKFVAYKLNLDDDEANKLIDNLETEGLIGREGDSLRLLEVTS